MPVPLMPLRIFLGVLSVAFCYWLGIAIAAKLEGTGKTSTLIRWSLRVVVTSLGAGWGGLDRLSITCLVFAVLSLGAGWVAAQRPKRPAEDLTKRMFPDQ